MMYQYIVKTWECDGEEGCNAEKNKKNEILSSG